MQDKIKLENIEKKKDSRSCLFEARLCSNIEKRIKKVFVTALKCIEIKFGKEFPGYEELRSEILREGNDAIRDLKELISKGYNIEEIPNEVLTFRFIGKENNNGSE
ncbi:MAG: hypothetical protein ACXADW_11470 [Candidatus Hodarchaeales archaeon]|jgi:hypothetical protein